MAIFDDMVANVYVLTNRPDLVAETKSQIKKAAIKLHGKDFFNPDLKEVILTLTPNSNMRYTIDLTDSVNIPRFRKGHYLREYVNPPTGQEVQYKKYDAADIMDDYNVERTNYFYQAGIVLQLYATKVLTQVKFGYYQFPDTSETTFSSWIANLSTAYIEEEAAMNLFKIIGKDEEYQKFQALTADNLQAIIMAGI